ncbi:DeoR/GlpR family DNA-binding transcription regulator [Ligilactobacillus apodemi]|nr:DeoR/GlpR family DNA-binding transcription regulator [Ligilactobacillus apodemi]
MKRQQQRIEKMLAILEENQHIHIKKLEELVGTSTSTLRRDLIELEKSGMVKRTFGFVTLLKKNNIEFTTTYREAQNAEEKNKISYFATKLINSSDAVFIDTSTTCQYILEHLTKQTNLKIITNNLAIAQKGRLQSNLHIFLAGGALMPYSNSFLGTDTLKYLANFHARLVFFSCNSISEKGIFMADMEQTRCKQIMLENADISVLLVDHTKFRQDTDFIKMAPLHKLDVIITDQKPKESFLKLCQNSDVKVIY